jgi:hypothetical protein
VIDKNTHNPFLQRLHRAACGISYYNAAEGDQFNKESHARAQARQELAEARRLCDFMQIEYSLSGYLI